MEILIIDCNDSFVNNIVTTLNCVPEAHCTIMKSEEAGSEDIRRADAVIVSPGPGLPDDMPGLKDVVASALRLGKPLLGICLGMQAIARHFGASLSRLENPMHGHKSLLHLNDPSEPLFRDMEENTSIGRYHSWIVDESTLPSGLRPKAYDEDGNVMAIRLINAPVWGVQFHPESIITEQGSTLFRNFCREASFFC